MAFSQFVKQESSNKNYAFEVSVSKCYARESKGTRTYDISYGDLHFENNNITNNKCGEKSSISSSNSGSSWICNFSTFRGNNQTGSMSLSLYSSSNSFLQTFSYCNVIGNKCGVDNNQVLFWCWYRTNVDHSIFRNNTAVYIFEHAGGSDTLTISSSYAEAMPTLGSVEFADKKDNFDFNNFSHFDLRKCPTNPKKISKELSNLTKMAKTYAAELIS
ncbi:hypothetical protein TVAG_293050 [Trichomonas vaginalis G3]|uniref:Uncharacterized protein n=1 Tax=Trichomonas vaginalis (strain ATCC PRA-98 / G3) TaxID=412133 RepID=A2EWZ5_TRIV3|nr:hypothetical protein TVAGG3_0267750 [Trichomonas vaginalis G3]EAY02837.1 hypothetical protein TVAG_293050 [Trichomonas vaginalis G3]KAI5525627.1 hypothetical protein TVAGG3_0267750 [Trichomonas vaginalis G3]|eukprot:XP_001315060.1 hypothetical protein [Trichomonas vaginalis G3]